jgi:hypothetical protein
LTRDTPDINCVGSLDDVSGAPPAAFVDAVKDALNHLYDFSKLNSHPLVR